MICLKNKLIINDLIYLFFTSIHQRLSIILEIIWNFALNAKYECIILLYHFYMKNCLIDIDSSNDRKRLS